MKRKQVIIAVCSSLVVLAGIATATFFAIFNSGQKTETSLQTGVVNVQLVERFGPPKDTDGDGKPDDSDGDGIPDVNEDPNGNGDENPDTDGAAENSIKVITGDNIGTQPAYIRVKIFPQVEINTNGTWNVSGGIPASYIFYTQENNGWVDGNDGYFYYTKILPAGETTTPIIVSNLHLDMPDIIAETYKNDKLRVNMLVKLESTQASNELYKINWGLDSLPPGVETMP